MEVAWDTKTYKDYLHERPIFLVFYIILQYGIVLLRVAANVAILALKVKKFHHLSGLEVITLGFIAHDALLAVSYSFCTAEYFFDKFHSVTSCNVIHTTYQYAENIMKTLTITIMILAKFKPNISKFHSYFLLSILWVLTNVITDIFRIRYVAVLTRYLSDGQPHHVCYPHEDSLGDYFDKSSWVLSSLPWILIFIAALFLLFLKRPADTQNKETLHYGVAVAGNLFVLSWIYIFRVVAHFGFGLEFSLILLTEAGMALNPFIYFFFHRMFYKEIFIKIKFTTFNNECHEVLEES